MECVCIENSDICLVQSTARKAFGSKIHSQKQLQTNGLHIVSNFILSKLRVALIPNWPHKASGIGWLFLFSSKHGNGTTKQLAKQKTVKLFSWKNTLYDWCYFYGCFSFCIINCFRLLKIIPYHLSIHHRLCSAVVSTFASQQEGQGFNCWTSGLSVPEWMVVISPPWVQEKCW